DLLAGGAAAAAALSALGRRAPLQGDPVHARRAVGQLVVRLNGRRSVQGAGRELGGTIPRRFMVGRTQPPESSRSTRAGCEGLIFFILEFESWHQPHSTRPFGPNAAPASRASSARPGTCRPSSMATAVSRSP